MGGRAAERAPVGMRPRRNSCLAGSDPGWSGYFNCVARPSLERLVCTTRDKEGRLPQPDRSVAPVDRLSIPIPQIAAELVAGQGITITSPATTWSCVVFR